MTIERAIVARTTHRPAGNAPVHAWLHLSSAHLPGLFAQGGLALARMLTTVPPDRSPPVTYTIALTAANRRALMVAWLRSLLQLHRAQHWVPEHFVFDEINDQRLVARVTGTNGHDHEALVHGVASHGTRVVETGRGFSACAALIV